MFRKRSFAIVLFLVFCFAVTLMQLFRVTPRHRKKYQKMISAIQPRASYKHGSTKRGVVQKDLWIDKEEGPFHYLMVSGGSILHLNQNPKAHTHALEEMDDITCFLQQKKYYKEIKERGGTTSFQPHQQVCVLKMNKGHYNYFTNEFVGQDVLVFVYELKGHELTTLTKHGHKLLEGCCTQVEFKLDENKPKLITQNLKAKVYTHKEAL